MINNHSKIYSSARLYDLAFRFKNVPEENSTVLAAFERATKRKAKSFLDIAAGPASNAIKMGKRGLTSFALDYSQEMVEYGLEKAKREGVELKFQQGDMRNFALKEKVDCAAIFMDSTSYLLTNQDVLEHLESVAEALVDDGIYILEMAHPRDVFRVGKSSATEWTDRDGGLEVQVQWGSEEDVFDPLRQVTTVSAKLKFRGEGESGEICDRSEQRCFTYNEMDALVRASGRFRIVEILGSLKPGVPFSNAEASWRMIPVLQKI